MEFFKKATQISKTLTYTNILSPKSIFKVALIFGQREGPLDVECHTYIYKILNFISMLYIYFIILYYI